jgi:5-methylcytosine-specific restriction endonuclease McrA
MWIGGVVTAWRRSQMFERYRRPYDIPAWRKWVRPGVLRRDGYVCQTRGPRCTGTATCVDHIVSWRELDRSQWLDTNLLRAACGSCNSRLGARRQGQLADIGRRAVRGQAREW